MDEIPISSQQDEDVYKLMEEWIRITPYSQLADLPLYPDNTGYEEKDQTESPLIFEDDVKAILSSNPKGRKVCVYKIDGHPGAYLLPSYLNAIQRKILGLECVLVYTQPPHGTNLTALKSHHDADNSESYPKFEDEAFKKIRWACIGYQYDWTNRRYFKKDLAFPSALKLLCQEIVGRLGFQDYKPESALVNFYHQGDRLRGHLDDAEGDNTSPLVSISLGASCFFLLGKETRSSLPQPIILKAGDVLIISGLSRMSFHGVPKLLNYNPQLSTQDKKQRKQKHKKQLYVCENEEVKHLPMVVDEKAAILPEITSFSTKISSSSASSTAAKTAFSTSKSTSSSLYQSTSTSSSSASPSSDSSTFSSSSISTNSFALSLPLGASIKSSETESSSVLTPHVHSRKTSGGFRSLLKKSNFQLFDVLEVEGESPWMLECEAKLEDFKLNKRGVYTPPHSGFDANPLHHLLLSKVDRFLESNRINLSVRQVEERGEDKRPDLIVEELMN